MISEYAKSRIDSLSEEDLRHEVSLGSSSRFQREKFAYIQNRLSDLETKRMQENAQASNPANESWVARHTGTLIMALAVIIAPVIGGVILIYSQNLSPPDNTRKSVV